MNLIQVNKTVWQRRGVIMVWWKIIFLKFRVECNLALVNACAVFYYKHTPTAESAIKSRFILQTDTTYITPCQ